MLPLFVRYLGRQRRLFLWFTMAVLVSLPFHQVAAADGETKPFDGKRGVIPGKIEAEHFDLGPPEVAYHDVDRENQGAEYREKTEVDIEKRDDASNGHGLGWTKAGEWVWYSVHVKKSGRYSLTIPVASNRTGGTFHLEVGGKDITGPIHVPDTGGWDKLQVLKVKKINLIKGNQRIKMIMDQEGASKSIGDIDCLIFESN